MKKCICEHSNPEDEVLPNITEKVKGLETTGSDYKSESTFKDGLYI